MDGRKRCKNASVDEKLFIRFRETENGGFRKRISVDRALTFEDSWSLYNGSRQKIRAALRIYSFQPVIKVVKNFSCRDSSRFFI